MFWKCMLIMFLIEFAFVVGIQVLAYYKYEWFESFVSAPIALATWYITRTIHRIDYKIRRKEPLF